MISEQELVEAIRACEKEPLTPSKVSKLADFYVIYDHLFGEPYPSMRSYAEPPTEAVFKVSGDTEFLKAVNGKDINRVMTILNDLVDSVKVLYPQMYTHLIDNIYDA